MLITGPTGQENMLTPASLLDLSNYHAWVSYNVTRTTAGVEYTYQDLCFRDTEGRRCQTYNVLVLWGYNNETIAQLTQEEILQRVNENWSLLESMVGTPQYNETGYIVGASALLLTYYLRPPASPDDDGNNEILEFERELVDFTLEINKWNPAFKDLYNYYIRTEVSMLDEVDAVVNGDTFLIGFSFILTLIFTCAVLGQRTLVHSRALLGLTSLVTVLMSLVCAFGASGYVGVLFTVLSPMVIFILVGIGVDGMLIIVDAFTLTSPLSPMEDRVGESLAIAGPTITLTGLTSVLAFAVGSTVPIVAIGDFCLTAAFALLFLFMLQVTFFVGWMVLDQRRIHANRADCCPCYVVPAEEARKMSAKASEVGIVRKFFQEYYIPALLSTPGKIFVIVVFTAAAVIGGYLYTLLGSGLPLDEGFRDDSYLGEYFRKTEKYFPLLPAPLEAITGQIDYTTPENQQLMRELYADLLESEITIPPVSAWFMSFESWSQLPFVNRSIVGSNFYPSLRVWLTVNYSDIFQNDVVWNNPYTQDYLVASRYNTLMRWQPDIFDRLDDMDAIFDLVEAADLEAFSYSEWFIYNERDRVIDQLTLQNLFVALLAVFASMLLFLDLRSALLIALSVAYIDLDLFFMMYITDTPLEIGSFICLCLAVGLSVDYCVHIGISYFNFEGTRTDQVREAMIEVGPSVLNGALSTLAGVCVLAFAGAEAFRVFFKMLTGSVTFGILHGLAFFPVLLTLFGKQRHPAKVLLTN
eukprot:TRINITY_DN1011_c0_g1_i5.p1 TRINITY_DN1011_c0_g1~~TRINITY_DN1011_c0_g1_i5.p1  ORF type:complete len:884 (-),score=214.53 TRINITY_DN1011_c0_g1_i5:25-2283(-)